MLELFWVFSLLECVLSAGGDMSSSFELSSEEELNSMHANRKRSTKPDIASTYFDQRITIPRDGEEAEVSFFVFVLFLYYGKICDKGLQIFNTWFPL